jgi:hypothetical protein
MMRWFGCFVALAACSESLEGLVAGDAGILDAGALVDSGYIQVEVDPACGDPSLVAEVRGVSIDTGRSSATVPRLRTSREKIEVVFLGADDAPAARIFHEGGGRSSDAWPALGPARAILLAEPLVAHDRDEKQIRWFSRDTNIASHVPQFGADFIDAAPFGQSGGFVALSVAGNETYVFTAVRELGESPENISLSLSDLRDPRLLDANTISAGFSEQLGLFTVDFETRSTSSDMIATCHLDQHDAIDTAGHIFAAVRCGARVYFIDRPLGRPATMEPLTCDALPFAPRLAVFDTITDGQVVLIAYWSPDGPMVRTWSNGLSPGISRIGHLLRTDARPGDGGGIEVGWAGLRSRVPVLVSIAESGSGVEARLWAPTFTDH